MNCFYHEDRVAVATCQSCGKGLCKECAQKYVPCKCDQCQGREQAQKQIEQNQYIQQVENELKIERDAEIDDYKRQNAYILVFFIFGLVLSGLFACYAAREYFGPKAYAEMLGLLFYFEISLGSMPFGFYLMRHVWGFIIRSFLLFVLTCVFVFAISGLLGPIAFPIYIVVFIKNLIKIHSLKKEDTTVHMIPNQY